MSKQPTPQDTANPAKPPQDTRYRRAAALKQAVERSPLNWSTRTRAIAAIDRYETTVGPHGDQPQEILMDRLIEIGEICTEMEKQQTGYPALGHQWAISAIERLLKHHPSL